MDGPASPARGLIEREEVNRHRGIADLFPFGEGVQDRRFEGTGRGEQPGARPG